MESMAKEVVTCFFFPGSFDDSSQMRPLRSTSTVGGHDYDTSFDASDIIPNNNGRPGGSGEVFDDDEDVVHVMGGKSPLPPSEAQDRLDDSIRLDLCLRINVTIS